MLFERFESKGLAHYSYLIGDEGEAAVIDPRRDCGQYLEKATVNGLRIAYVLETHRNEDYVIGSMELAAKTGAVIWHADEPLEYKYGKPASDGQTWKVGRLSLRAIHSPGHTPGSMSYLLLDPDGAPWMLFTGDALFAGDVGRVDLLGMDKAEQMAGLLHETLYNKLLPLGDGIIVHPAHGPGSVCGTDIAERSWTTIGLERKLNPKLNFADRDEFISNVARELERPPYFLRMEKWNLEGAPPLDSLPVPDPLTPEEFERKAAEALVLDTRMELGFAAAHVPGSLSIWLDGLPSFAGWFLSYDTPILLVNETDDPADAVVHLRRLGFDNIAGFLAGGILKWHMEGKQSASIHTITASEACSRLDLEENLFVLDVRSEHELEEKGRIRNARHIHLTGLPERLDEVPKDRTVYLFCGSDLRSMSAASILKRSGWTDLTVVLGGLTGWKSNKCPIEK